ncbi:MAG: DUF4097 family beta strand repeat protein [Bacilli bacterium]|nr:DUF4097 family beta strand repeat protein [Bacilli bacterium]
MNKGLTITLITLLSLIVITLIVGLIFLIDNKFTFKLDNLNFGLGSKSTLIYDENIDENFNKIDVYSKSLDFKFVKSNDNTTNVKIYDDKKNTALVKVEDNTLKITSDNDNACIFCFYSKRQAVISLPEKIYDLVLETTSGDIYSEINFNKADLNTRSGDIELNNIKNANIKVTSGDIIINEVDDITIKATSGDIEINKINKHIDSQTTSGDVEINNLTLTTDSNIKVTSGDVSILNGSDDIYYNTSVISGDVKVNNNNRHANVELTINTTSGDIIVRN